MARFDQAGREPIIEPELPIIDPHHHLWDRRAILPSLPPPTHGFEQVLRLAPLYLMDELTADMTRGHNVVATVFMECGAFYRADGTAELKPVGEVEFVNGVAAMGASGVYGAPRACAAIVGHADLKLGSRVGEVLDALIAAGNGRFRGIRHSCSWDADPAVLGPLNRHPGGGLYLQPAFREGFAQLSSRGLSFDAWMLEPQLPDLINLARAFPDTTIVLDHCGTPLGVGAYQGKREERFPVWLSNIEALAALPNVNVKLGGLAMPFCNFESCLADPPASSEQLAREWRPYIDACVQAFGPERCMMESNFPVDLVSCSYDVLWNALKRCAAGYSAEEKAALFSGTARRVYELPV